jgi:DNA-binding LacI/PurR family transcriptional regulator
VIERRLPTVLIEGDPIPGAGRVDIDQVAGATAAATHLKELGHTKVAIIAERLQADHAVGWASEERITTATEPVSRGRVTGYRQVFPDAPVYEARGNRFEAGYDAANVILDDHPEITAILAETDMLAFGTQRLAGERGLSIPQDLSLVGFDDIPPAVRNVPPLTTVRQPLSEKGEVAYRLLQELLAGEAPRNVMLPVELIVRESTAPPR